MRRDLHLEDEHGIVISARQEGPDTIRIYNAVGGKDLTREQADELAKWLDDGASSVWQAEAEALRREAATVRGDIERLLSSLKGAWWLDAAAAYERLSEWVSRR